MKNFFGQDVFRVVFFLLLAGLLTVGNVGCDLLDDDDDDSSAGGAATATTTPPATPAPAPEATPAPSTTKVTLSGTGILWKPVSEGDRNLVILLPKSYSSGTQVSVISPDGKTVIGNGRYVGRTNGDRPTYRFSKPGGGYPDGSYLRVGSKDFHVPDTSRRYI